MNVEATAQAVIHSGREGHQGRPHGNGNRDLLGGDLLDEAPPDSEIGVPEVRYPCREFVGHAIRPSGFASPFQNPG